MHRESMALMLAWSLLHILPQSALAAVGVTVMAPHNFAAPTVESRGAYLKVSVAGCSVSSATGAPMLPFRTVRIPLPPDSRLSTVSAQAGLGETPLSVTGMVNYGRTPVHTPRRGEKVTSRQASDRPTPAIYQSNVLYPPERAQLVSVQRSNGRDIALVRVFPVQYEPVSGRLLFAPQVIVTLDVTSDASRARALSRVASAAPTAVYDYLLITRTNLLAAFQPLVDRRTQDGLSVRTETVESITNSYAGRDAPEKIRTFIRYAHTNWGVSHALLGGDAPFTVPCRFARVVCAGEIDNVPSDLYYACLDGSWNSDNDGLWGEPTDGEGGTDVDLFAEVYVGRAPVDTPAEAAAFVDKVLRYEQIGARHPVSARFMGGYLGLYPPDIHAQGGDGLDPLAPVFSSAFFGTEWLDDRPHPSNTWFKAESLAVLNDSPHLVVHYGHADDVMLMELDEDDLAELTNQTAFLLNSAGCDAGAFDWVPDAIGDEFVKKSGSGAFAAVLNSRLGWFDASNEWMYSGEFQLAFFSNLIDRGVGRLGVAQQLAKQDMAGFVESSGDMPYRWCYYTLNLLGDPWTPVKWDVPDLELIQTVNDGDGLRVVLQWRSVTNRQYSISRRDNLSGAPVLLTNHVAATPPFNTYTAAAPAAACAFYSVAGE